MSWPITIDSDKCPLNWYAYHIWLDNGDEYKVLQCGAEECTEATCPMKPNPHIGSTFDEFMEEEGLT
jgi:hypothetical protein